MGKDGEPSLTTMLSALARDPHRHLVSRVQWTRRDRARGPIASRLALALTRPGNLGSDHLPLSLPDQRIEASVDVYENRIVRTFVAQVEKRLRRLRHAIDRRGTPSLAAEAAGLASELRRARRAGAAFLEDVSELRSAPTATTMVLLRRAEYRLLFMRYLAFQRGLSVRLDLVALDTPLESLPTLYQLWGTLQVIDVVLEIAATLGYRLVQERLIGRDAHGPYLRPLPDGEPAVSLVHPVSGRYVTVIPERTYLTTRDAHVLWATTYQQRPDVAVEVCSADSGERNVLLFDPKYKAEGSFETGSDTMRPVKPDIDKMHAYRDAIRDEQERHVVSFAATLYPGKTVRFRGGIAALCARPSAVDALRADIGEQVALALA